MADRRGVRQGRHHAWWVGYLAALMAVALVSALIGLVLQRVAIANISMLYLIAVLVTAIAFGHGPAILASVTAFLTFDWFFVAPHHTFTIADPDEWVALLLFLLTAVVTGQLAARERERAAEAEQRERAAVLSRRSRAPTGRARSRPGAPGGRRAAAPGTAPARPHYRPR